MRTTSLSVGHYYRNILRSVVLIVGEINPGTKWYRKGFRFVDQRGSYYNEHGSVLNKTYGDLDLVESVKTDDVTEQQMIDINKGAVIFFKSLAFDHKMSKLMQKIYSGAHKSMLFSSGANFGMGVLLVAAGIPRGWRNIIAAVGGMTIYMVTPDTI